MTFTRLFQQIFGAAVVLGTATAAVAQYPERPIRFVVPFTAGSSTDLLARAIGNHIAQQTTQPVIVDNKPGANSFIGASEVARASPDGYTVFITTNTSHAANEHLFKTLPYDPVKDFTPLTALAKGSLVMVVHPGLPIKTPADLIDQARRQPGRLAFGSGTSSSRIASELFTNMSGVDMIYVPYKSNPPALADLMGGQLTMMMADTPTALPLIKGGKVRPIAVSGKSRSDLLPETPTLDESGVKGYEMSYWFAAYAPARLPQAVQARLVQLISSAVRDKAVQDIYKAGGLTTYLTTPAGLLEYQLAESRKWAAVIKAAGIQPE